MDCFNTIPQQVYLAAGWLGAVLIVPNFSKEKGIRRLFMLTMDIIFAIFCVVGAYLFRIL